MLNYLTELNMEVITCSECGIAFATNKAWVDERKGRP